MMDWTVAVAARRTDSSTKCIGSDPRGFAASLRHALEGLGARSITSGAEPDRVEASYVLEAETWAEAVVDGIAIWEKAAIEVGVIDQWPAHRFEVLSPAELEITVRSAKIPRLAGTAEAAKILGVEKGRVSNMKRSHPTFPKPLFQLASGPVWSAVGIEQFEAGWDRSPGRPRRALSG